VGTRPPPNFFFHDIGDPYADNTTSSRSYVPCSTGDSAVVFLQIFTAVAEVLTVLDL